MFGYVEIDKPNILVKDFTLYRSFYCGLCKSIGRNYKEAARLFTNYDVTFLTVFVYALTDTSIEIENKGCILNPMKKKPIVKKHALLDRMADVAVLLAAYKLSDDVNDSKSLAKKSVKAIFKKDIAKAKKREKKIAEIIEKGVNRLEALEKNNCDSVDKAADPFATMLSMICSELVGAKLNRHADGLMYNIGRFVYIIDAIDDTFKDKESGNYNPFLAANYECADQISFLEKNLTDLRFLLYSTIKEIKMNYEGIGLNKYEGIITNILWYGLPARAEMVLTGKKPDRKRMEIKV